MYISLFSGGIASFVATLKVFEKSPNITEIWFFDTKIEDQDTYRFINDCQEFFGKEIKIFSDGRNPWQVFQDERFIGNSRITPCNKILKRKVLERVLKKNTLYKNATLVFGISSNESFRTKRILEGWQKKKVSVEFPLVNNPIDEREMTGGFKRIYGITPPRLYKLGFKHNNCGGACVKAGISQWSHLFEIFPDRYLWHELQENMTRELLNKDVSILRDRNGGITKPLTLSELRRRLES